MRNLIILLLFCQFSFAQYNLFARQNFAKKVSSGYDYNYYVTGDTDALAYITASGISGTAVENSTYHIFYQLKNTGLYTKLKAFWLFKGTTATMQKYNAKNPVDTNSAFRLTFTGSATFSDNGYQLNGTSYANSYFNTSTQFGTSGYGVTIVCGTNNAAYSSDTYEYGNYSGVSNSLYGGIKNNNTDYKKYTQTPLAVFSTGINESRGVLTGNNYAASIKMWFNKASIGTPTSGSNALPNSNFFIGAVNVGGSPYGNSNQRIQMVFLHEGLTDTEVVILHNIIDASENIAGRKTW